MPDLSFRDWPHCIAEHIKSASQPLIVIVGPTAGGKTSFSLDVAKHIGETAGEHGWKGAEVINADSRQLYRHLDIGTAKINDAEMGGTRHHLIDVLDPNEEATIAWYKKEAVNVIDDCHARNVVPLLVGGSMLYISAVVDGLDPLPKASAEQRAQIEALYDEDDGWTLFEKLQEIDPATAANFDKQNKVYVVRAMELFALTGLPPSTLKKTIPPPYQVLMLGLRWPRETIVERINARTRELLENGWIEEVEGLIDRGYTATDPAMKSHGYKEIMAWLASEDRNVEELSEMIARKTRAYAKRQMTWWGDDDRIHWIDAPQLFGY